MNLYKVLEISKDSIFYNRRLSAKKCREWFRNYFIFIFLLYV